MKLENQRVSYRVDEAAAACGLTRSSLYRAIGDGSLRSAKVGKRRIVTARALEEYVAHLERESAKRGAA